MNYSLTVQAIINSLLRKLFNHLGIGERGISFPPVKTDSSMVLLLHLQTKTHRLVPILIFNILDQLRAESKTTGEIPDIEFLQPHHQSARFVGIGQRHEAVSRRRALMLSDIGGNIRAFLIERIGCPDKIRIRNWMQYGGRGIKFPHHVDQIVTISCL